MIPSEQLTRAVWRTSSYSGAQGGNCVEVGPTPAIVGVRDTKNHAGGTLSVRPETWRQFVAGLKR